MKIGVLALQGSVVEHIGMLESLGVDTVQVRLPKDLEGLDGLIIPGGESTTIGKLVSMYDLMDPIRAMAKDKAIWGTCAGMIFMAKDIGMEQPLLGIMDIHVRRNAFGRQIDSFVTDLFVEGIRNGHTQPFPAVFIRAPRLEDVGPQVKVISRLNDGTAVAAVQGKWMVTAFHPELTQDARVHEYFLSLAKG